MTTTQRIIALATAIGTDIKNLVTKQGDLTSLSTTAKGNLVAAINELFTLAGSAGSIDDVAGDGITNKTWSANKIFDTIEAAKVALKNELTNGASAALDTLSELSTALNNNPNFATAIAIEIGNRIRFDAAQTLTVGEKLQACENLGIGNPDYDFLADYNLAKA